MRRAFGGALIAVSTVACGGTTGSDLVQFRAFASGPESAAQPLVNGLGYQVTLTRAVVHIGAIYLNQSVPTSGAQATPCVSPGLYVGEVIGGLDVDALSSNLQPFPADGEGTATRAASGEVWLTGGDVNANADPTVILDVAGTAERGGATFPFDGQIHIGDSRVIAPRDPSLPGANPICEQRIVAGIATDLTPRSGGSLVVRIDPAGIFANVDFAKLDRVSSDPPRYAFADNADSQPNINIYDGLRARGTYGFTWLDR